MKLIKPQEYTPGSSGYRGYNPGYDWLKEWRLNKHYRYWYLMCGHITDMYEQERYSVWAPKGKFWCEQCGHWNRPLPNPKPKEIQEPLF